MSKEETSEEGTESLEDEESSDEEATDATAPISDPNQEELAEDEDFVPEVPNPAAEFLDFEEPAYNDRFYSLNIASLWPYFAQRTILSEKLVHEPSFSEHRAYEFFEARGLIGTVEGLDPFAPSVIREFYCNLSKNFANPDSPKFGRVYLRGRFYELTVERINAFFDTPNIEEPPLEVSMDVVARELTGGYMTQWASRFPAKHLIALMAMLYRVCILNWIPTKNNNLVSTTVAEILY